MNGQTLTLVSDSLWPMLKALVLGTIPLTAASFVLGLALALVVALMRLSTVRVVSGVARVYISIIRGTPLLLQLFLIYYGLPSVGVRFNPFPAAIIALSLNVGGYAAEVIRAAILSVPKGQWEAASTIGMGYTTTLRKVVLPQATRKDSDLVAAINKALADLQKDGTLTKISEKYFSTDVSVKQ